MTPEPVQDGDMVNAIAQVLDGHSVFVNGKTGEVIVFTEQRFVDAIMTAILRLEGRLAKSSSTKAYEFRADKFEASDALHNYGHEIAGIVHAEDIHAAIDQAEWQYGHDGTAVVVRSIWQYEGNGNTERPEANAHYAKDTGRDLSRGAQ